MSRSSLIGSSIKDNNSVHLKDKNKFSVMINNIPQISVQSSYNSLYWNTNCDVILTLFNCNYLLYILQYSRPLMQYHSPGKKLRKGVSMWRINEFCSP